MTFKESSLWRDLSVLVDKGILSENAWDYVDACTDDWEVTYKIDFLHDTTEYTVKTVLSGVFGTEETKVTATYTGNLSAICSLLEHLAHVEDLLMEEWRY